jgi:hypothetical protein
MRRAPERGADRQARALLVESITGVRREGSRAAALAADAAGPNDRPAGLANGALDARLTELLGGVVKRGLDARKVDPHAPIPTLSTDSVEYAQLVQPGLVADSSSGPETDGVPREGKGADRVPPSPTRATRRQQLRNFLRPVSLNRPRDRCGFVDFGVVACSATPL